MTNIGCECVYNISHRRGTKLRKELHTAMNIDYLTIDAQWTPKRIWNFFLLKCNQTQKNRDPPPYIFSPPEVHPSNKYKTCVYNNTIKHKNRDPHPCRFSHNPKEPPKSIWNYWSYKMQSNTTIGTTHRLSHKPKNSLKIIWKGLCIYSICHIFGRL